MVEVKVMLTSRASERLLEEEEEIGWVVEVRFEARVERRRRRRPWSVASRCELFLWG